MEGYAQGIAASCAKSGRRNLTVDRERLRRDATELGDELIDRELVVHDLGPQAGGCELHQAEQKQHQRAAA